jgi:peptidoglycan/LPS O-acetylase OafA/YrhL
MLEAETDAPNAAERHAMVRSAILGFAIAAAVMLLVYVALFKVDSTGDKIIFGILLACAIGSALWVHTTEPMSHMRHPDKLKAQRRREAMLTGALGALLLLVLAAAATGLNAWGDWVVLGGLALTAVGGMIAVQTTME